MTIVSFLVSTGQNRNVTKYFLGKTFFSHTAGARIPGAPLFRAKCDYRVSATPGHEFPTSCHKPSSFQSILILQLIIIAHTIHAWCQQTVLCIFPPVWLSLLSVSHSRCYQRCEHLDIMTLWAVVRCLHSSQGQGSTMPCPDHANYPDNHEGLAE